VITAAKRAPLVLLGSLLNLDAVIAYVRERTGVGGSAIQLACAGTDGAPAIEDVYVAGAISAELPGPRTDAALIAEAVRAGYAAPLPALAAGANARVLRDCRLSDDIGYCALTSELDCVPVVVAAAADVAIVADSTAAEPLLLESVRDELRASVIGPATAVRPATAQRRA
jgi:phosphosulfolactate phosphohydrolase-like enzyme